MSGNYVDISAWQNGNIDWHAYKVWSAASDGVSRVAIKASEGVGYRDPLLDQHRNGALAAGIDEIYYYHFARSDLGNTPEAEADWCASVVGAVREHDTFMLDTEVRRMSGDWAFRWLDRLKASGHTPLLYASESYIRSFLQDARLAIFPLVLAFWTFNPNERPACPPPWQSYTALQYTDRASIPGMPGLVDADIFLSAATLPPSTRTYTIQSGDTLWAIAEREHTTAESLYERNAAVLEQAARDHRISDSDRGHWIFPGTIIQV